MTLRFILAVSVVLTVTVAPVCAEVMDKEPTVIDNWAWALLGGGLAVIAWRWRWWLGAIVSVAVLGGIYFMYQEINDPFVGLPSGERRAKATSHSFIGRRSLAVPFRRLLFTAESKCG